MKKLPLMVEYILKFLIVLPFWLLSTSPTRKSWKEFTNGLKKHKCDFDYSKRHIDGYYECKHLGCNRIDPRDLEQIKQDELWLKMKEWKVD